MGLDFGGWFPLDLCLGPLDLTRLTGLFLFPVVVFWPPICMSRDPSTETGTVDLSVSLPCGLRVTISGPSSSSGLAASLLRHVAAFDPDQSAPSEFELVSSAPGSPVAASDRLCGLETRDQVRRSLQPCPPSLFVLGTRLCGSSLSGKDRVCRAWTCGQWAAAVRSARIGSPDRTPPIDLKNRFYAVLRAEGLEKATIFRSSAGYWACIGSLNNSESISQSFPSEVEAKIYLQAAGEKEICFAP